MHHSLILKVTVQLDPLNDQLKKQSVNETNKQLNYIQWLCICNNTFKIKYNLYKRNSY